MTVNLQGSKRVTGTSLTSFIQGGNRAPRLMSADEDGPSIGFTTGYGIE